MTAHCEDVHKGHMPCAYQCLSLDVFNTFVLVGDLVGRRPLLTWQLHFGLWLMLQLCLPM